MKHITLILLTIFTLNFTSLALADGWVTLSDAKIAQMLSAAEQTSYEAAAPFGCGPNQAARILGCNYEECANECPTSFGPGIANPAMSAGPLPIQLADYMSSKTERDFEAKGSDELTFGPKEFIETVVKPSIRRDLAILALIERDKVLMSFPKVGNIKALHYLVIVGYNLRTKELRIIDTNSRTEDYSFDEFLKLMDASETMTSFKNASHFRKNAKGMLKLMFAAVSSVIKVTDEQINASQRYSWIVQRSVPARRAAMRDSGPSAMVPDSDDNAMLEAALPMSMTPETEGGTSGGSAAAAASVDSGEDSDFDAMLEDALKLSLGEKATDEDETGEIEEVD